MSTLAQRATALQLIRQACSAGARLHRACAVIGLAAGTVQRWLHAGKNALHVGDRRTSDQRIHDQSRLAFSVAEFVGRAVVNRR